jgi:hypothetical protein
VVGRAFAIIVAGVLMVRVALKWLCQRADPTTARTCVSRMDRLFVANGDGALGALQAGVLSGRMPTG